jgi:triacylglycerol lipase
MKLAALLPLALIGCAPASLAPADGGVPHSDNTPPPTVFPSGNDDGGTRAAYPIVLAHGLDGFKNIGPLEYYYGVPEALTADGRDVHIAVVDPYNSSDVRGAQLLAFVQQVLAQTGAPKVNMICHSQGGLDCRYVASSLGSRVGAIVTIAAPHRGDAVADIALGDVPGPAVDAVAALLDLFGAAIDNGAPDMNAMAAFHTLSTAGAADFTRRHPDDPRVAYYSIAGRSNLSLGDDACASATEAPFVARWDGFVDPVSPLLSATASLLNGSAPVPPANDGLVTVASARWGTFLGCIPADHLDEIGQIGGPPPGQGNPFDRVLFYRELVAWLVEQGF